MPTLQRTQIRHVFLLTNAAFELNGRFDSCIFGFLLLPPRKLFFRGFDSLFSFFSHAFFYHIHVGELLLRRVRDDGHFREGLFLLPFELKKHMDFHVVPLHMTLVPSETLSFHVLIKKYDGVVAKLEPLDTFSHEWKQGRSGKQNSEHSLFSERVAHELFHGRDACSL